MPKFRKMQIWWNLTQKFVCYYIEIKTQNSVTLDFYCVLYYNKHTDASMVSEIHKEDI